MNLGVSSTSIAQMAQTNNQQTLPLPQSFSQQIAEAASQLQAAQQQLNMQSPNGENNPNQPAQNGPPGNQPGPANNPSQQTPNPGGTPSAQASNSLQQAANALQEASQQLQNQQGAGANPILRSSARKLRTALMPRPIRVDQVLNRSSRQKNCNRSLSFFFLNAPGGCQYGASIGNSRVDSLPPQS
ncbi:MAG: hypothetical protein R3C11_17580 [Planctomycetaceae bacterium]